jgi:RNA polymerase sigma-70 factor (ECF subfamily)
MTPTSRGGSSTRSSPRRRPPAPDFPERVYDSRAPFIQVWLEEKAMPPGCAVAPGKRLMADPIVARELLRSRESLFAFLLALVRDFDEAEEMFQEISLRILERAGDFRPGTNFGAWAREFARRTLAETRRARSRLVLSEKAIEGVAAAYAEIDDSVMARKKALNHCMDRLEEPARKLVEMRFGLGLSMEELGRRTDRKAGTVQVALSRIRSRLAECVRSRLAGEAAP